MTAYILYYREPSRVENTHAYMKRFAYLHGMEPIVIDRKGDLPGSMKRFATLEDALSHPALQNHTWVWLDSGGDTFLDEYAHPEGDVVYCIGSDFVGFDNIPLGELTGAKVKLRQIPNQEGDWYASIVAPLVVYDRFLYVNGRRK